MLPDLLGTVLPSEWKRGAPASWTPVTADAGDASDNPSSGSGGGGGSGVGDGGRTSPVTRESAQPVQSSSPSKSRRLSGMLFGSSSSSKKDRRGGGGGGGAVTGPAAASAPLASTHSKRPHPPAEWFRRLWSYLAGSKRASETLTLLADAWPLVPTNEGKVPIRKNQGARSQASQAQPSPPPPPRNGDASVSQRLDRECRRSP